jgi:hypothetical protein
VLPQNDQQKISERAYFLWQREGCPHGKDMDHWLQAEQDMEQQQGGSEAKPKAPQAAQAEAAAATTVKRVRAVAKTAAPPKEDDVIQSAPKPRGKARK